MLEEIITAFFTVQLLRRCFEWEGYNSKTYKVSVICTLCRMVLSALYINTVCFCHWICRNNSLTRYTHWFVTIHAVVVSYDSVRKPMSQIIVGGLCASIRRGSHPTSLRHKRGRIGKHKLVVISCRTSLSVSKLCTLIFRASTSAADLDFDTCKGSTVALCDAQLFIIGLVVSIMDCCNNASQKCSHRKVRALFPTAQIQ